MSTACPPAPTNKKEYIAEIGTILVKEHGKKKYYSTASAIATVDWLSIPDIDIDASWLDFGDVFEGVIEGIGEFITGIFDGVS